MDKTGRPERGGWHGRSGVAWPARVQRRRRGVACGRSSSDVSDVGLRHGGPRFGGAPATTSIDANSHGGHRTHADYGLSLPPCCSALAAATVKLLRPV
ncbi:hypothetical protein GUJ93_ZPchr0010g8171 [Zizania palustris]|uniref:Uncharacterized protein n=1 Tax=Zizania palustris TaxID=103762 RepID=A0A8J6BN18_ZIZPA|nr:hypothetical protein GUJ93_ZPchr0010g8171 [Zizania palustris]